MSRRSIVSPHTVDKNFPTLRIDGQDLDVPTFVRPFTKRTIGAMQTPGEAETPKLFARTSAPSPFKTTGISDGGFHHEDTKARRRRQGPCALLLSRDDAVAMSHG